MTTQPSRKPWHEVVQLRDDLKTGELSLGVFAADLHDVTMQKGRRPVYEDPAEFFALTYPRYNLRELVKDACVRLAALCLDKIDQEKGGETRAPDGTVRMFRHPWSILAFQLAGPDGLRLVHAEGKDEERDTPPAEPLLAELLSAPRHWRMS